MSGIYRLDTQTACVFLNKHSQCVFVWVSPLQRYLPVFPSADVDGTRASPSLDTSQTLQINKIKSLIHSILHLSIKCVCVCVKVYISVCVFLHFSARGTSPCRMRMKCRLFSVSLSVNMAMPPIPECTSSGVRRALNVSVRQTTQN